MTRYRMVHTQSGSLIIETEMAVMMQLVVGDILRNVDGDVAFLENYTLSITEVYSGSHAAQEMLSHSWDRLHKEHE